MKSYYLSYTWKDEELDSKIDICIHNDNNEMNADLSIVNDCNDKYSNEHASITLNEKQMIELYNALKEGIENRVF